MWLHQHREVVLCLLVRRDQVRTEYLVILFYREKEKVYCWIQRVGKFDISRSEEVLDVLVDMQDSGCLPLACPWSRAMGQQR